MTAQKHIIFPAEWHKQSAIQLTWPHPNTDWDYMLEEVEACYIEVAKAIACRQPLWIVCENIDHVRRFFGESELQNIRFIPYTCNDTWARDHAGISIFVEGKPTILDFQFNGWGLKFAANRDNQMTQHLHASGYFNANVNYESHLNFVLEGGSVESDGEGTLLTTAPCLLAPNRNQPLSKEEIEDYLKKTLGVQRILWLNHGYLAGDDTDSHVDTLARLCDKDTIVFVDCVDTQDEHYTELQAMKTELESFRTSTGQPYKLIALPMADAVEEDGERLPATYANFLIMDKAVLVPIYQSDKDQLALSQLQQAFPTREIVGIDCRALIKQHGSLHCITMQYPEGFI